MQDRPIGVRAFIVGISTLYTRASFVWIYIIKTSARCAVCASAGVGYIGIGSIVYIAASQTFHILRARAIIKS